MFIHAFVIALTLQAPAQQARVAWVPNPRRIDDTWVADPSHHLAAVTVRALNAEIDSLERVTGVEIAVVVVDSTSGLEPFEFALALHRTWGVGKAGRDNGIVFLWVPAQRAVQISIGYGLEGVLPDRRVGRIRDTDIFPAFRRGAFDEGVLAGVRALAAAASEETSPREGLTAAAQRMVGGEPAEEGTGDKDSGGGVLPWLLGVLGVLGGGIAATVGLVRWRRRRPRPCPKCGTPMPRLQEEADDEFLDKGQRAEEKVRSVDYDVFLCPKCREVITLQHRRFFTTYGLCQECGSQTLTSKSKHLHGNTSRVTVKCANCGWGFTSDVTSSSSSSSSSDSGGSSWSSSSSSSSGGGSSGGGGGSFGGGSAGGGGAGGHY